MAHRRCAVKKNFARHILVAILPQQTNKQPTMFDSKFQSPGNRNHNRPFRSCNHDLIRNNKTLLNPRLQLFWETKKKPTRAKMSWRRTHGHHSCSFPPQSSATTTNHTHSNVRRTTVHQTDRLSCHQRNPHPSKQPFEKNLTGRRWQKSHRSFSLSAWRHGNYPLINQVRSTTSIQWKHLS